MSSIPTNEPVTNSSLQEIKSLLHESQQIHAEITNVMKDIVPLEFESYTDYFIINTFKRGRSESGKVDMLDLMRRDHTRYYQKIKRSTTKNNSSNNSKDNSEQPSVITSTIPTETTVTPPPSSSSSLDYLHKLNDEANEDGKKEKKVRMTRSRAQTDDINLKDDNQTPTDSNWDGIDGDDLEDVYNNELESEPSETVNLRHEIQSVQVIKQDEEDEEHVDNNNNYRRRSSRISKKQEQKKLEKEKKEQLKKQILAQEALQRNQEMLNGDIGMKQNRLNEEDEEDNSEDEPSDIKDLYETLVPKIKTPSRRSDWVLPPRLKYQPEKPIRTKVVVDSIKVHELIDTERITKVLSHFEGGVAGIRKTFNTNRASATPQVTTEEGSYSINK